MNYQIHTLPRKSDGMPQRFIEHDIDGSMIFTVEFPCNKSIFWKSMLNQAEQHFKFIQETRPKDESGFICTERRYNCNVPGADEEEVLIARDGKHISISVFVPTSTKAVNEFFFMDDLTIGCCCKRLKYLIEAAVSDKEVTEEFERLSDLKLQY